MFRYLTAIVTLGHIAFHLPEAFPVHIKNLVSRKIVKELLMQDRNEVTRNYSDFFLFQQSNPVVFEGSTPGPRGNLGGL